MDLEKLFHARHACRKFKNKAIDYSLVKEIVEKACLAPSACNSQPWRVIITADKEQNEKMVKVLTDNDRNPFLNNASAFVAILDGDAVLKPGSEIKFANDKFVKYDVGQFVAYLTLYAESKGVSSLVVGWVNNQTLKENFNTNGLNCSLVVALGYSDEKEILPKKRKNIEEIIITEN